jgi:hypothetical protein
MMIRDPESSWNSDRASLPDSFHHCTVQMACRPLPLGPEPYLSYLLPFSGLSGHCTWLAINGIERRQYGSKYCCHIAYDVGLTFTSFNDIFSKLLPTSSAKRPLPSYAILSITAAASPESGEIFCPFGSHPQKKLRATF